MLRPPPLKFDFSMFKQPEIKYPVNPLSISELELVANFLTELYKPVKPRPWQTMKNGNNIDVVVNLGPAHLLGGNALTGEDYRLYEPLMKLLDNDSKPIQVDQLGEFANLAKINDGFLNDLRSQLTIVHKPYVSIYALENHDYLRMLLGYKLEYDNRKMMQKELVQSVIPVNGLTNLIVEGFLLGNETRQTSELAEPGKRKELYGSDEVDESEPAAKRQKI